jgi:hypothetical protein
VANPVIARKLAPNLWNPNPKQVTPPADIEPEGLQERKDKRGISFR